MHKLTIELPVTLYEELKIRKGSRTIKDFITGLLEREFEAHSVKVLILCGGTGAKLQPLTSAVPKALIPVGYKPLIDYQMDHLSKYGFGDAILLVGHLSGRLVQYLVKNQRNDISLTFVTENTPLDTAGAIGNARSYVHNRFVVMNSDVLTNLDINALLKSHEKKKKMVTFAAVRLNEKANRSFGVVTLGDDDEIQSYKEKDGTHEAGTYVNAGYYVMEPSVLNHIPYGEPMSLSKDLFPRLLEINELACHRASDNVYWREVTQVESYAEAWQDFFNGKLAH